MLGDKRKKSPEMITAQEGIALARKYGPVNTSYIVTDLAEEFYKQIKDTVMNDSRVSDEYRSICLMSAIYEVGRVQGIREQRRRHRKYERAVDNEKNQA